MSCMHHLQRGGVIAKPIINNEITDQKHTVQHQRNSQFLAKNTNNIVLINAFFTKNNENSLNQMNDLRVHDKLGRTEHFEIVCNDLSSCCFPWCGHRRPTGLFVSQYFCDCLKLRLG